LTVSIIIVNYNVKFFLEQCLYALRRSTIASEIETIVLDNQSTDGSVEFLEHLFPEVKFIRNNANLGFAKACNKGLEYSTGKYVLFLNPDTIVAEDTLERCVHFFETHADAGAVGVRMISGSGEFLKESKRSFPGPLTSLYKLFGLSRLFPKSKTFSRYYLGHLEEGDHEVDVLAGAFMMIRRRALDKIGAFDEAFFMYGEDIDLSYRIQKAGYKNYYLSQTSIIHFKGESTKRGSLNYVRMFYKAMSIFVQKHYAGTRARLFIILLHIAIWLRALIAMLAKLIRWIGLPVIDAAIILVSFWSVQIIWAKYIKPDVVYSNKLLLIAFPVYTLLYLLAAYYAGLYNKYYRRLELVRSMLTAIVILLAGYSLLPEHYRFSRGVVLFGSLLAFALITGLRHLFLKGGLLKKPIEQIDRPFLLVAAHSEEYLEASGFLKNSGLEQKVIGRVAIEANDQANAIATLPDVKDIAVSLNAEELVFCVGKTSYQQVISFIGANALPLRIRFHASGSSSIVGSDSDTSNGQAITSQENFNLAKPARRRLKRLIDVSSAIGFLLLFPVHFLFHKKPLGLLQNALTTLFGKKTWIGYHYQTIHLPPLREAVVSTDGNAPSKLHHNSQAIDYWYAKNYDPLLDIKLILKNYKHLGN
jgi:GT2 family glycosyltransferase